MSDETGGEAAVVESTPAAPEAALSSERDYEADARKQGWRPKEEWAGDPENWKDAKTYVEHGDLKSRLSKMEKDFDRLSTMQDKTVERLKKQHAKEIAELTAQKKHAIKQGDVATVEAIDERLDEIKTEGKPEKSERTNEEVQEEWVKKNPWFDPNGDNPEMYELAFGYSNRIAQGTPSMTMEDNLARVDAYMRKKFPDFFGEKRAAANGHAAVDGGGDLSGIMPRSRDTMFSKLGPEAKAQAKKDVDAGLYKNTEEWAKVYFS